MTYSNHYKNDRQDRENLIKKIGEGEVVFSSKQYNEKKGREFIYEISSTAILTIKDAVDTKFIISRYPARPSRLKKYWSEVPQDILNLSIEYSRKGLTY